MVISSSGFPETINQHLAKCIMEIPLQRQDELIQFALKCLESRIKYLSDPLTSPHEVQNYLRLQLAQEMKEVFAVLFLDNQHRVIAFEKVFYGTINTVTVHPRVTLQHALHYNAAAVILTHNHPSGALEPSMADREMTSHLKSVLELIDIRVLDHIIVSLRGTFSFAELGLM